MYNCLNQTFFKLFLLCVIFVSKVYADCSCVITASSSSTIYNISNKTSGNGGFTITINGDDAAESYYLKLIHNDSDDTPVSGDIDATVNSYGSNGLAAMAGANAESFNVDHSTLASMTGYSTYFAEGSEISFWIDWQGSTTDEVCTVTGGGYESNGHDFLVDLVRPTVTAVSAEYAKDDDTPYITGAGYNSPGNATAVSIGGQDLASAGGSFAINSNTRITLTIGGGDYGGNIIVTDKAGNTTSAGGIDLVVDNTAPGLTNSSPSTSVKEDGLIVINGSGFAETTTSSPIASFSNNGVTMGDSNDKSGLKSFIVNSATQITVTAGSGNVNYNHLVVKDAAGNISSDNDNAKIAIDNTLVTLSAVNNASDASATVFSGVSGYNTMKLVSSGSNFTLGNSSGGGNPTITINDKTLTALGITPNYNSNALITLTVGASGEDTQGTLKIEDTAGNITSYGNAITIDRVKPTVSSINVNHRYAKAGTDIEINGSGFTTNGNATKIFLTESGGSADEVNSSADGSISVDSDVLITFSANTTEWTDANVTVADVVGNVSTDTDKLLTVDNTAQIVSAVDDGSAPYIFKEGTNFDVKYTGGNATKNFTAGSGTSVNSGDAQILINDKWPTGMTASVGATAITLTAGSEEINGALKVKDRSTNLVTFSGPIIFDNTAPTVSDVTPDPDNDNLIHIKNNGTVTVAGDYFNNGVSSSDVTVKIGSVNWTTLGTVTVDNINQISLKNTNDTKNESGNLTITDVAGNELTASTWTVYVDNTDPVITEVEPKAIKSGEISVVTGSGFKNGEAKSEVKLGSSTASSSTFTYDVISDTRIEITGGTGDISDQIVVITDPAGNELSDSDFKLTIDNTAPSVSSISTASIKNGATTIITGSGFHTSVNGATENSNTVYDGTGTRDNPSTDIAVNIGGSIPAGMTFKVNSNTQITITAGTGEAIEKLTVRVTDRAGNESVVNNDAVLTIDNTAPSLRGLTVASIKESGTTELSGAGFLVGGDLPNNAVKIGGNTPTGMTYGTVTTNSLIITGGSGEVADLLVTVEDAAGNVSTDLVYLTIDNTTPVVSNVATAAIRSGQTSVISGGTNSFLNSTPNSSQTLQIQEIYVDGSRPAGMTWQVDAHNQLTITAGSGEVTNKNITVKDSAGNWSTSTSQFLTIDNTAPELTSVTDRWIKNGESTVINGSGFQSFGGDASAVTIGGKDLATAVSGGGLGGSFVVNSDTKITVTAGAGEVTRGLVTVTDAVGNESNSIKAISIDNTRPAAPEKLWIYYSDTGTDEDDISSDSTPHYRIKGVSSEDSIVVRVTKAGTANNAAWLGKPSSSNGTQYLYWNERTNAIMADPNDQWYNYYSLLTVNGAPVNLTDNGEYALKAFAIDSAGNESSSSANAKYTFDNIAPDDPVISRLTEDTDTGESSTDGITNSKRPELIITNVPAGYRIRLYGDDGDDKASRVEFVLDDDTTRSSPDTILVAEDIPHDPVLKKVNNVDVPDNAVDFRFEVVVYDTAGNSNWSETSGEPIFEVDQVADTAAITYGDNPVWSGDNTVDISVKFTDNMNTVNAPKLDIYWPGDTDPTIDNAVMTQGANDSLWTYQLTLIDDKTGNVRVVPSAFDKAGNLYDRVATQDTLTLFLDNTPPDSSHIGLITAFGDTSVTGWFNDFTDSLKYLVPLNANDSTLLRGGKLRIESNVRAKLGDNTWRVVNNNAGSVEDSIIQRGNSVPFVRSRQSILSSLDGTLFQGDTIRFRATVFDRAGNSTSGDPSESVFVLDTLPPGERPFVNDTLYTHNGALNLLHVNRDTIWTNDSLKFAWFDWPDSVLVNERPSGLSYYRYSVWQSTKKDPGVNDWAEWRTFKNLTQDTLYTTIDSLRHDRKYYTTISAVDTAGNRSDTVRSSVVLRQNVEPAITAINDTTIKEDIEWKRLLEVKDDDVKTLLGDVFTYELITMAVDTIKKDSAVVTNLNDDNTSTFKAKVSTSGELTFTPSPLDSTGKDTLYLFRIIVTDAWTKDDTFDINVKVLPVNDNPIINLSAFTKFSSWGYKEGARSDSIPLTRYVYDEDNDTTDLKYTFKITSSTQNNPGYPTAKIGFLSPVSRDFKKIFLSNLIDEYPTSTIMQKNDAYLIYPAGISDLKDPVKVDSTSKIGDVFTDTTYAWIMPTDTTSLDTNYYTLDSMMVEFTVIDPGGLTGKDTIPFFINPKNDPPVWSGLRDTVVTESDSISLDFANYLIDTDDTLLTVSILPLTYSDKVKIKTPKDSIKGDTVFYISRGKNEPVNFKPQALWYDYQPADVPGQEGELRTGLWNPKDTLSNRIQFEITAADDSGSVAKDTFSVRIQRVPRPEIRMYVVQNNAFTDYYEIFLIDSLASTKDISLKVQSEIIRLDTAAAYTYIGYHYIRGGIKERAFDIYAKGTVGDTTLPTQNITFTLAKTYGNWSGSSADGRFGVLGRTGSVDYDQTLMILDSSLFEPHFNDKASYLLGNESSRFKKSVQVSLLSEEKELAIYQRSVGVGWIELPSYNENGQIMAYTDKMGYFKMGPKTLIVPGQTSLHQNYPNPFNPSTTIEYDLGFIDGPNQRVNITVYDILGRNIKTLINEQQSMGRYRVKWNGKDQNDVPVSSGIYFVNLMTDNGRAETKKIMLMR